MKCLGYKNGIILLAEDGRTGVSPKNQMTLQIAVIKMG